MHFFSSFNEYCKYEKTENVQCDNVKPVSYGGLTLPETHYTSINHITALHILALYFIHRAKDFCFLL